MKRWVTLLAMAALAACSKAPDGSSVGEPDAVDNAAGIVAFDYRYSLALPAARIADLQDAHAQACERLAARCRITGLRYAVGGGGAISASLSLSIAAPLARGFGRDQIKAAEAAGATLTGADITGTDAAPDQAAAATSRTDADTARARMARELARTDLTAAERTELRRQQAAAEDQARAAQASAAEVRERLTQTPLVFIYETGRGNGLLDRLRDAGDTALASIGITLTAVLWIVAGFGPPLLVLAVLYLLWRRWGRHGWAALLARTEGR